MAKAKSLKKPAKPRKKPASAVDVLMPAVEQLSVADRRKLIARIEETLPEAQEPIVLHQWQKELIDKRLADAEANPGVGTPWREVLDELRTRR
ncbi:MAG: addiction module protein [Gemmataceae bacterium]|nr:addiction module protein [Gemmataceae bacterium]